MNIWLCYDFVMRIVPLLQDLPFMMDSLEVKLYSNSKVTATAKKTNSIKQLYTVIYSTVLYIARTCAIDRWHEESWKMLKKLKVDHWNTWITFCPQHSKLHPKSWLFVFAIIFESDHVFPFCWVCIQLNRFCLQVSPARQGASSFGNHCFSSGKFIFELQKKKKLAAVITTHCLVKRDSCYWVVNDE